MLSSSMKNTGAVGKVLLPSLLVNLLSLAVPLTVLQIYDRILPNQSYGTATLLLAGLFLFTRYVIIDKIKAFSNSYCMKKLMQVI